MTTNQIRALELKEQKRQNRIENALGLANVVTGGLGSFMRGAGSLASNLGKVGAVRGKPKYKIPGRFRSGKGGRKDA